MHLQMLHEALHIAEHRRSLAIARATAFSTAASDTRRSAVGRRPSSGIALRGTEQAAKSANFAFTSWTPATDVIDVGFEMNVGFG